MKNVVLILTLNVSIVTLTALYVANKVKKFQKDLSVIYVKLSCLDDNCNDRLSDIKTDLEKKSNHELITKTEIIAAIKRELGNKVIKLKKKKSKRKFGKK